MTGSTNLPGIVVTRDMGIECTMPDTDLRHYISDHELNSIGDLKSDHIGQLFWASLGAFVGLVIPTFNAVAKFQAAKGPFDGSSLATIILACMSLSILFVSGLLTWGRSKRRRDLVSTIRARPRVKVSPKR
jgi:hypothetical protein